MNLIRTTSTALFLLSAAALVAGCATAGGAPGDDSIGDAREAILNGDLATNGGTTELFNFELSQACSATIIASQWALTAAHCVVSNTGTPSPPGNVLIPGGLFPDDIVVHPTLDVALIHVTSPFAGPNWRNESCPVTSTSTLEQGCLLTPIASDSPATLDGQTMQCEGMGGRDNEPDVYATSAQFVIDAYHVVSPLYWISANALNQIQVQGDSGGGCFAPPGPGEIRGKLLMTAFAGSLDRTTALCTTADQFSDWVMGVIPPAQRVKVCGGTVVNEATACSGHCGTYTDACGDVRQCAACPTPMSICGDSTVNAGTQVPVGKEYCCDRDEGSPFLCCAFRSRYAGMCNKLGL